MRGRATLAGGLAVLLLAAGCGADKQGGPIPAEQAAELQTQLNSVSDRIADGSVGACRNVIEGGDTNVDKVQRIIDSLPSDVDADVRNALQDSFDHLFDLVSTKCDDLEGASTTTETTPTETETIPTETETIPTETETTPTETNTTPTTPPPAPTPGQGKGGSDNGNSGGDSGGAGAQGAGG